MLRECWDGLLQSELATANQLGYRDSVSTVPEIQSAIENLSLTERGELAKWFNGWEDDEWDKEMARDFSAGGRLKNLRAQAQQKAAVGPLLDLP